MSTDDPARRSVWIVWGMQESCNCARAGFAMIKESWCQLTLSVVATQCWLATQTVAMKVSVFSWKQWMQGSHCHLMKPTLRLSLDTQITASCDYRALGERRFGQSISDLKNSRRKTSGAWNLISGAWKRSLRRHRQKLNGQREVIFWRFDKKKCFPCSWRKRTGRFNCWQNSAWKQNGAETSPTPRKSPGVLNNVQRRDWRSSLSWKRSGAYWKGPKIAGGKERGDKRCLEQGLKACMWRWWEIRPHLKQGKHRRKYPPLHLPVPTVMRLERINIFCT